MHASAQHPTDHTAPACYVYTGTLLHPAEARTAICDREGHVVPVICMDLELDNLYRTHLHVEQCFPVGHFDQARAAAHRLKRGMRVTVQVPIVGISLVASNASHIHVITPKEEAQACPA